MSAWFWHPQNILTCVCLRRNNLVTIQVQQTKLSPQFVVDLSEKSSLSDEKYEHKIKLALVKTEINKEAKQEMQIYIQNLKLMAEVHIFFKILSQLQPQNIPQPPKPRRIINLDNRLAGKEEVDDISKITFNV